MSLAKRPASDSFGSSHLVVKRQKSNADLGDGRALAAKPATGANGALIQAVPRTSGLKAPIMELSGHSGEVFACRFDNTGQVIASGSMDRTIMLWRTTGDCSNLGVLSGHKGAILDLSFSRDSRALFSASTDATICSWDLATGQRIRRHQGHSDIVNSLCISRRGEDLLISGSDDTCFSIWDPRAKHAVDYTTTDFPITAVAVAEAGNELYTGGIDNNIKVWDMRKKAVIYNIPGHTDTVTSLEVSPDSQTLLSYAHDGLARTWDIRPFAPSDRSIKSYVGAPMGLEKNLIRASWDKKGGRIASGSGDGTACVWDVTSAKLLYKLPGHKGTVNDVRFSPGEEPLIVSGSSDRTLMVGELGL